MTRNGCRNKMTLCISHYTCVSPKQTWTYRFIHVLCVQLKKKEYLLRTNYTIRCFCRFNVFFCTKVASSAITISVPVGGSDKCFPLTGRMKDIVVNLISHYQEKISQKGKLFSSEFIKAPFLENSQMRSVWCSPLWIFNDFNVKNIFFNHSIFSPIFHKKTNNQY